MNVAILGSGAIAEAHAHAIQALRGALDGQDLRLSAVMGRRPGAAADFARTFGLAAATTELDAILADPAIDAVLVCSPTPLHAAQTERALRAGKHVLCEIPLALSLAETDRLSRLAEQNDRRLMVCHTRRFVPALVAARLLVAAGEVHPHALVSRYLFDRRENRDWQGRRRSWTDNLLWHHGCHAVDTALWLLGVTEREEEVETAAQIALPGGNLDIPMDLSLVMRTARDQIVTVAMSYHAQIAVEDHLIIGEETTLLYATGELRGSDRLLVQSYEREGLDSPIARQDAEFFAAIREQREPAVSARAVRATMAALQAAQDTLDDRRAALGTDAHHPDNP